MFCPMNPSIRDAENASWAREKPKITPRKP